MENDEKVIRRALILSSSVSALIALGIIISVILLGGKEEEIQVDEAEVTGPRPRAVVVAPTILLTDITAQSGIEFSHTNGAYGSRMLPETMGGGLHFSIIITIHTKIFCSLIQQIGLGGNSPVKG